MKRISIIIATLLTTFNIAFGGISDFYPLQRLTKSIQTKAKLPLGYMPGEIIIRLKDDRAIDELGELNSRFNVVNIERAYAQEQTSQQQLEALEQELSGLSSGHESWFWFTDKNSSESKDYQKRTSRRANQIKKQIEYQKNLIQRLENRKKRAPSSARPVITSKNTYRLQIQSSIPTQQIINTYKNHPAVEYAGFNYLLKASYIPNDPFYNYHTVVDLRDTLYQNVLPIDIESWAHKKTGAEEGWEIEKGDPNIVIAVIDTGVDYNHEDLRDNIWRDAQGRPGKDFVDVSETWWLKQAVNTGTFEFLPDEDYADIDDDPMDYNGHGTQMAGIAAARGDNGIGVAGVSFYSKIMPVRAGFSILHEGEEVGLFTTLDAVNAINYAVENGADIINLSFCMIVSDENGEIERAIQNAYAHGVLIVAGAGNEGTNKPMLPTIYEEVIAVAATDRSDERAIFSGGGGSQYGSWVDIAAPGTEIWTTSITMDPGLQRVYEELKRELPQATDEDINKIIAVLPRPLLNYNALSGTSVSCAYVSGTAALIMSRYIHQYPDYAFTLADIKNCLFQGADDIGAAGKDEYFGAGRVNVQRALQAVSIPQLEVEITAPRANQMLFREASLTGTAAGDGFSHYTVEIGKGDNPSSWSSEHIELANSGSVRVSNGTLATLKTEAIADGIYTLKVTVYASGGYNKSSRVRIPINNSILQGWPQKLEDVIVYNTSPVIIDIDNDKEPDIIVSTGNGMVYAWHKDGTPVEGWPVEIGNSAYSVSVGDIDNDGYMEIVVGSMRSMGSDALSILKHNGARCPGDWPKTISELGEPVDAAPLLIDLDKDKDLEIVFAAGGKLHTYHHSGEKMQGQWPVQLNGPFDDFTMPAAADIDHDGKPELILGQSYSGGCIYAYKADGTPAAGAWPVDVDGALYPPVIGDVNGDRMPEIILNAGKGLFVFSADGSILWSKQLKQLSYSPTTGAPILGDVDGDGVPEIIVLEGSSPLKLYVFKGDGSTFGSWPYSLEENDTRPPSLKPSYCLVADIDADSAQEILVFDGVRIYVFEGDGTLLPEKQKYLETNFYSCPAVGDINGDNKLELAAFGLANSTRDDYSFYVYGLNGSFSLGQMDWPMLGANPQHTGAYEMVYVNHAPLLNLPQNYYEVIVGDGKGRLEFNLEAQDPDGDSLVEYKVEPTAGYTNPNDKPLHVLQENVFSWEYTPADVGRYYLTFYVKDNQGVWSAPLNITIKVNPSLDTTAPYAGSVDPDWEMVRSGDSLVLSATYFDKAGWQDLQDVYLFIGDNPKDNSGVYLRYNVIEDKLYTSDNSITWDGGFSPGSKAILRIEQPHWSVRLHCLDSKIKKSGKRLTLSWGLEFGINLAGVEQRRKNVFIRAQDINGFDSGWKKAGLIKLRRAVKPPVQPAQPTEPVQPTEPIQPEPGTGTQIVLTEASRFYNGNGDFVSLPDSDEWSFGSGDFTIDFWIKFNSAGGDQTIISQWPGDNKNYWSVGKNSADKLFMLFYKDSLYMGSYVMASVFPWSVDTWYHLAFVRTGATGLIFINGVSQALIEDFAFGSNDVGNIACDLIIGEIAGTQYVNGWLDEIRISKGIARWNSNFTPSRRN